MIDLSASGNPQGGGVVSQSRDLQFVDGGRGGAGGVLPGTSIGPEPAATSSSPTSTSTSSFTPAFLQTARHPGVCLLHLSFKVLALLSFMFGSFLFGGWNGDYVFSFVATTVFLSMDFWAVKNITGRLLVGMRWWNDIKPDGSSEWVFESHTDERQINATDKTVFWVCLYVWPLCWSVFLVVYLLRLEVEWVLLVVIGLALSGANLVGYWKCSKEAKRKVQAWASTQAMRAVLGRFGFGA